MKKLTFVCQLILILCLLQVQPALSQKIIDLTNRNPYQRIFVDTDDFDASYLDQLERDYPRITIDTVKMAVLNDLAYYTHSRDLDRSFELVQVGLALSREKKKHPLGGKVSDH